MKEVTMCCTTCPSGCALKVMIDNNEVVSVEGNNCPRGEKFAHKEWINPERMLTSTVYAVINGKELLIPVKSKEPIPRKIMTEAMKEIQEIEVNAPVKMGDVIKENLAGSGVELVACKTVKQEFAAGKRDSLRGLCFGWGGKFYLLLEGFGESPEGFGFLWSCFLKD